MNYNKDFLARQSTNYPLLNYDRPLPKKQRNGCFPVEQPYVMDNVFLPQNVILEFSNFSELQVFLRRADPQHSSRIQTRLPKATAEENLTCTASSVNMKIPPHIRTNIQNSCLLDVLIDQTVQHWCCFGFKVAPIGVEMIKDWRRAPRAIIYCVASISLVTLMETSTTREHSKQAAMSFYEEAKSKMDDVFLDNIQIHIVQSYFCLSYTSNLLRLYEQQRTWGGLASIALQHLADRREVDTMTLGCWFRWYYIDAWMCLTVNRDCLLSDRVPWMDNKTIQSLSLTNDNNDLYSFACLSFHMRKYIRMLHLDKVFSDVINRIPSQEYYSITHSLVSWYRQLPATNSPSRIHLHLCYHSVRLLILYQFIRPNQPPPMDILIDCLETNLELLQALRRLKETGCDQSTYHHMFYAIHNASTRIYQYQIKSMCSLAEEQLKMNFTLLKSTRAYAHGVFKMKIYAEEIQDQFTSMNISLAQSRTQTSQIFVFKKDALTSKKNLMS